MTPDFCCQWPYLFSLQSVNDFLFYFEMTVEICQTRLSEHSKCLFFVLHGTLFVICISPVIHLVPPPPPQFCITFVFLFFWVLQPSLENLKTILCKILGGKQDAFWEICKWQIPVWCVGVPCLFNLFFTVSSEKTRGFSNWNRWVLPVRTNERLLETPLPWKPFFPCSILRYSIRKTKGHSAYRMVEGYPWAVKTSLILSNFISVKISTHLDLMLGH